ncbi:4,5-DOPA dioxygenase extradiol 1-like, partial [Phragmites australis]|uniref:4,5-DOPA dioxygenase extradiol 1-like n=1 Tax=Phragmites australis TaxID=29695 RepID=UPI002D78BE5A
IQILGPSQGTPELAKRTKDLVEQGGLYPMEEDDNRGLDHDTWVSLMLMYPMMDISVCQLYVQPDRDAAYHYDLSHALAPLREDSVLILGSRSVMHNLRQRGILGSLPLEWASKFDTLLRDSLLNWRYEVVKQYEKEPQGKIAHPPRSTCTATGDSARAELFHHSWTGSISYASYRFTTKK